jgi:uncharacterized membrane protein (UPF0136 family)
MKKTAWIIFLYALLILIGGIIGHVHSASLASLISGLSFGILLLVASGLIFMKQPFGYWMALALSILLEGFFTWRFAKTLKFLPAGLLSLISLVVIIIVALKIRRRLRTAK